MIQFKLKQKEYENPLKEFIERVLSQYPNQVVSIVLFGSVAKGKARISSDVDLLVILKEVPLDWREKDKMFSDILLDILLRYHLRIFPIITSQAVALNSARLGNPLFYGILTGYLVLYDPSSFFEKILGIVKEGIKINKPVYIEKNKKWEMAKII